MAQCSVSNVKAVRYIPSHGDQTIEIGVSVLSVTSVRASLSQYDKLQDLMGGRYSLTTAGSVVVEHDGIDLPIDWLMHMYLAIWGVDVDGLVVD